VLFVEQQSRLQPRSFLLHHDRYRNATPWGPSGMTSIGTWPWRESLCVRQENIGISIMPKQNSFTERSGDRIWNWRAHDARVLPIPHALLLSDRVRSAQLSPTMTQSHWHKLERFTLFSDDVVRNYISFAGRQPGGFGPSAVYQAILEQIWSS